ncbi:sugar phosphate nucleotidyltransferase [Bacillus sp. CGMCC 1.16607]|uniref:sugar phosphate nucleotidyltransferase n=1 Tax=Bacillus sp. CGMCC 1.16607 TaxID=3351842 RepID=UPI00362A19E8
MNRQLLGVIDATAFHEGLEDLMIHRSLAAVPFAGRYRLIDFVLSSMVNSGIRSVAIFPKFQYRSLMDHLGSGKNWDLNRKRDGLFFFPSPNIEGNSQGFGCFQHFAANIDYFNRSIQEYTIISNCYTISNIDYRDVLKKHIESDCDITEITREGRSIGMFMLKTSLLVDLINHRNETGYTTMRDIALDINHSYKICRFEYDGYAVMIDSIQKYFSTSLNMLDPTIWKQVFLKNRPIFTKVKDEPPTRYFKGSVVQNAMIANGCQIEGELENSIIARGVKIGKGSKITNCIILQKCQIGENCILESVILDKDVRVEDGTVMIGTANKPRVIRKGTVQGALIKS